MEEEGSWGDSKKDVGRERNSKVELMWVVGGWLDGWLVGMRGLP